MGPLREAGFEIDGIRLSIPEALLAPALRRGLERGWYERAEREALAAHLAAGDRVLELGGGAGLLAALAARGGAARVVTVEADPRMLRVIGGTLARNGIEGVETRHGAVVADPGRDVARLRRGAGFWASSTETGDAAAASTIEVPALPFADLLEEIRPSVLVCDVEGAERDFFRAAPPAPLRVVIMELHPDVYGLAGVSEIVLRLAEAGFGYQPRGSWGAVVCFERIGGSPVSGPHRVPI